MFIGIVLTFKNEIKSIRISENGCKEEIFNCPILVDSTAYAIGKKCHLFNKFCNEVSN